MSKTIKISRGADIKLKGAAEHILIIAEQPETVSIKPTDFHGLTPKLAVKVGDEVSAGSELFYSKYNEKIKFTSPVSGEIVEIKRGDKRKILEIKVLADKKNKHIDFGKSDPNSLSREEIISKLLSSGVWPLIRQRPYSNIANPFDKPKSIFISGFKSAPLATDVDFILHGQGELFQFGINAISKLTDGKVHLNLHADHKATGVLSNCKGVQINKFSGPHPSGNVGIQIHHVDPINKGEKVWYMDSQTVLTIGALFKDGIYDATRIVALTGSQVKKPKYYKTVIGVSLKNLLADQVEIGNNRIISGDVLSGTKTSSESYLGFYDDQITVIPEGVTPEFMGWLAPGTEKFSLSKTFFSWLTPNKEYDLTTALNGEERAFVMSGQYENVLPMDIYPVHLLKAILAEDIEQMENLGIYEVAPEDFALCEYSCTSKIDVQHIVRKGLDLIEKECG